MSAYTLTLTVPAEALHAIMGDVPMACGYWASVGPLSPAHRKITERDADGRSFALTMSGLLRGLGLIVKTFPPEHRLSRMALRAVAGELMDGEPDLVDATVQLAMFGKIVYG